MEGDHPGVKIASLSPRTDELNPNLYLTLDSMTDTSSVKDTHAVLEDS